MPAGTIRTLLRVRLSYRNIAPEPLILPTLYHVSRLLVSRSIENGANGRFLFVAPHYLGASDKIIPKMTLAPTREFEVVPEGHTANYFDQHDVPILLDVHNPLSPGLKTELLGRRVYLQLELNHLPFSKEIARDLTQRWKAYGHLWTGKVRSSAMEINVPHAPKISNCDGEFGGID